MKPEQALIKFLKKLLEQLKPKPKKKATDEDEEEELKEEGPQPDLSPEEDLAEEKIAEALMQMLKEQAEEAEQGKYPNKTLDRDERAELQNQVIDPLLKKEKNDSEEKEVDKKLGTYAKEVLSDSLNTVGFDKMAKSLGIEKAGADKVSQEVGDSISEDHDLSHTPADISSGPAFKKTDR